VGEKVGAVIAETRPQRSRAENDRVAAAYGSNYPRLAEIKKRYDPENIFHLNQNIKANKGSTHSVMERRMA
jgi:FAD/FMN-containing dehydrogenase